MNRREFLKSAVVTGAALSVPPVLGLLAGSLEAAGRPDLCVACGSSPVASVRAALDGIGGIGRFVSRGDIVVVKPNIGWDRTPEQGSNTHPEVVKAIVRQCLDAGAKRVLVFDRSCNDERRAYAKSGILAAVESL
ncbi:MAG: DUF362 domain-containing protein, partial [Proteobacteria bacterium]|nr:DUF362 domain-containing protein [Pseudomonadota bacterium]